MQGPTPRNEFEPKRSQGEDRTDEPRLTRTREHGFMVTGKQRGGEWTILTKNGMGDSNDVTSRGSKSNCTGIIPSHISLIILPSLSIPTLEEDDIQPRTGHH